MAFVALGVNWLHHAMGSRRPSHHFWMGKKMGLHRPPGVEEGDEAPEGDEGPAESAERPV